MLFSLPCLILIALTNAQLPEILKGKVSVITTPPSTSCASQFVNNSNGALTTDDLFCGAQLVPVELQARIPGLACSGYACALRFLGCRDATYRTEAAIVNATGKAPATCAQSDGLNVTACQSVGKFITNSPLVAPTRKRDSVDSLEPFTRAELDEAIARLPKIDESLVDLRAAKLMLRAFFPVESAAVNHFGLAADDTLERHFDKRDAIDAALNQTQLCSPLIGVGISLLVSQQPSLAIAADKFGPCGMYCELAMCGLQLMCHTVARSALLTLEATRASQGCAKTSCTRWAAPVDMCSGASCNAGAGRFKPGTIDPAQCPPPQRVYSAGQQDPNDCCDRCDDPCAPVVCQQRSSQDCGEPSWPLCKPFVVERANEFDCCPTCGNACSQQKIANCPEPPPSCPHGQLRGPENATSCCLACVAPCEGVSCPGEPSEGDCAIKGMLLFRTDRSTLNDRSKCADCCARCVPPRTGVLPVTLFEMLHCHNHSPCK
jgi:hypothetical protein